MKWIKSKFNEFWNSLSTSPGGLSARKLTAFYTMMVIITPMYYMYIFKKIDIGLWYVRVERGEMSDFSDISIITWCCGVLLPIGLVTIPGLIALRTGKAPKDEKQTEPSGTDQV